MAFDQAIFQHIVETTKDGLLVVDSANKIVFANPAAAACLSQTTDDLVDAECQLPFAETQAVEHELICPTGRMVVLEIKTAVTTWHGEPAHLLTLYNITQYRRIAEHTRYVTLLGDITRAAIGNLSRQELLQMLADRLGELHRADGCFLTLWDDERQTAVLGATFGPLETLYPRLFTNNVLMRFIGQERVPLAIQDVKQSRYFSKEQTRKLPIHSLLLLPLTLHEQYLGVIVLLFQQSRSFTDAVLARAQQAAEQTTLVLAKEKLVKEIQRRSYDLESLAIVSAELRSSRQVADMLMPILQTADLVEQTISAIFLLDVERDIITVAGCHPSVSFADARPYPKAGILEHVITNQRPYLTQRLANDSLANQLLEAAEQLEHTRCNIFLPLQSESTDIVGVLYVGLLEKRDFTNREIGLLTAVTEIAVSAFQRTLLLETLEARVDERTHELASANQKLLQLDRLRAKFVTDMSHELRTPVTTFQLYLDLLDRSPPEKRERYLSILRTQTTRLTRLIEKALALSQVDITQAMVDFDVVDFNEVVKTAVHTYRPSAEGKQLALHMVTDPTLPYVSGSKPHLLALVSEILDNAIHYNKPKGNIWVSTVKNERQLELTIADNGIGVVGNDLEHLFERFYRGENTAQLNVPGTGLGLAIVREIVEMHYGDALVRERRGGGTAVSVWLPFPDDTHF